MVTTLMTLFKVRTYNPTHEPAYKGLGTSEGAKVSRVLATRVFGRWQGSSP